MIRIYHNPRCSKSRETLDMIEESGENPEIVEYLKTPPTATELRSIIKKLGIKASDLLRKEEELFKKKYRKKMLSEKEWIEIMVKNPVLIQRPVVVKGNRAILGRPPQNVLSLLKE